MFIDEISLHLKAGKGGDGVIRWRHEKGIDKGGPAGGNGGAGGDVYAEAIRDIGILTSYKDAKEFQAEDGSDGENYNKQGKSGDDFVLKLPVGSVIKNLTTGFTFELQEDGQKLKLLSGGRGGLGNTFFKSSTNQNPRETTPGEFGEEADFEIELELIIDFGIIGLPNTGKSSLLNSLTNAKSKVGSFPFTTIEPHLGAMHGIILGDIPGLIEGASLGKGLGHKFLRHIKRTKGLIHTISSEENDPIGAYEIVRKEILNYNKDVAGKPEILVLTKADLVKDEVLSKKLDLLKVMDKEVIPVSIIDDKMLKNLADTLSKKING